MVKPAVGVDRFGRKVRRESLHDHIPAKDDVLQADRHMAGTMPRQMDEVQCAELHVYGFIREIDRNGLVDGFCKTVHAEDLITRLFSETGVSQERSETASDPCQSRFVMRHRLHIQFMNANLRLGNWMQSC